MSEKWTGVEKAEYDAFQTLCERIGTATVSINTSEPTADKETRKKHLAQDFERFAEYYFPHYIDSKFGWFHLEAAKEIEQDKRGFFVLEWPREHAKSVFADIMMPMYLYARGELSGMVVASANESKAKGLLGDIQAEFVSNEIWKNDYGNLAALGSWTSGNFMTTDKIGFWALGRGQSPRGIRKAANRPNYCVIDDMDDKTLCKNEQRVRDAADWVLEDLYYALSIKGARLVIAGNRIHKKSILSFMVGDIEPDDPKREGLCHIKVFALENPTTKEKDDAGVPAWCERYTLEDILDKIKKSGYRASRREFFHEHLEQGILFQFEWIEWTECLPPEQYDEIVVYGDPSFKNTKQSDYKAIVATGRKGRQLHILRAWVRQATTTAMVNVFYDFWEIYGAYARYYIEANMLQDLIFRDEFDTIGEARGMLLPIRQDKRKKPDKYTRIENMTPYYERGLIKYNQLHKKSADMNTLINQTLAFPTGNDDGPDAQEGGISLLHKSSRGTVTKAGKYKKTSDRR